MNKPRRLTSGQRALLKYWRDIGLADAKGLRCPATGESTPLHRIGTAKGETAIRSWSELFEAMDAFNGMAHYFEIDMHLQLWHWD